MDTFLVVYVVACMGIFAVCWLGMAGCLLYVFAEAIRRSGSTGPYMATWLAAAHRRGELSARTQRAVWLGRRFKLGGFWAVGAVFLGILVAIVGAALAKHLR